MSLLLNKLKNVVTEEEFKEISDDYSHTIISERQRNGKLLILLQKGESAFDLFVSALKEEDKHLGHESLLAKIATRRREGKVSKFPITQPHGQRRVCSTIMTRNIVKF